MDLYVDKCVYMVRPYWFNDWAVASDCGHVPWQRSILHKINLYILSLINYLSSYIILLASRLYNHIPLYLLQEVIQSSSFDSDKEDKQQGVAGMAPLEVLITCISCTHLNMFMYTSHQPHCTVIYVLGSSWLHKIHPLWRIYLCLQ